MSAKKQPMPERFWSKVDKGLNDETCCWLWKGTISTNGYGEFYLNGKHIRAHRFTVGINLPEGKEACHHCDNRKCVRPSHIFIGTRSENIRDCVSKGRHNPQQRCLNAAKARLKIRPKKGVQVHSAKLTDSAVAIIKTAARYRGLGIVLAKRFGVSAATISSVLKGKTWTHIKAAG